MPLSNGTKFGPYEILGAAGAGGMGEVYKARDTRLDRTVAVKVLPSHLSSDARLRQRFEREARAVSSLNHPQICVLYDVGQQDGTDYIVMEYLEGETLAQRLERGALLLEQVLKFGIQIADALDKAHRQGVVHRDLKPGNIMLTASGAKLMDFGLAKAAVAPASSWTVAPTMTSPVTQQGTIVGTFQYMSPEQVEGGEVDARTDIFAFGAVLYEMLTGRRAFPGKTALSVASAVMEKEPEPISTLAPMTPPALERTIRKCLAKDPEDRWQTARDLLLELKWIAEAGSQAGVPVLVSKRRRATEKLWAGAAVLLLVGTAALGLLYYRAANREQPVVRAAIPPPEKSRFLFIGGPYIGPVVVAPDGRALAFTAQSDGGQWIYVRELDAAAPRQLAGTDGGAMPFWSPDSTQLGFFVNGKLKKIDAKGGPAITLCDVSSVPRGGTWGTKGVIVFAPSTQGPLQQVNESGGECKDATRLEQQQTSHRWPRFLPDGERFLFYAREGSPGTVSDGDGVFAGSLKDLAQRRLMHSDGHAEYASGYLLFLREGTLMAQPLDIDTLALAGNPVSLAEQVQREPGASFGVFSASQTGALAFSTGQGVIGSDLSWFDLSGKEISRLGERAYHMEVAISPDGRKVAASIVGAQGGAPDIWIYDSRMIRSRFTFDPGADRWPIWSPDSGRIVFSSNRSSRRDLYLKSDTGTGNEELLLKAEVGNSATDWSSDGRYILFEARDARNQADIWALSMVDRKPIPILQTQFQETEAVFSPDGHWIAYTSNESGKDEVYVTPFPGAGRKWQISPNGGSRPRWPKRGNEILYLGPGDKLSATEFSLLDDTFTVGRSRVLYGIRPSRPGTLFDVSPDGKRLLVNSGAQDQSSDPITLMLNWPTEAERKASARE